jgi:hypothetical protein
MAKWKESGTRARKRKRNSEEEGGKEGKVFFCLV